MKGLTAADFEVTEDGKPQTIRSFTFEEISEHPKGDRDRRTCWPRPRRGWPTTAKRPQPAAAAAAGACRRADADAKA